MAAYVSILMNSGQQLGIDPVQRELRVTPIGITLRLPSKAKVIAFYPWSSITVVDFKDCEPSDYEGDFRVRRI